MNYSGIFNTILKNHKFLYNIPLYDRNFRKLFVNGLLIYKDNINYKNNMIEITKNFRNCDIREPKHEQVMKTVLDSMNFKYYHVMFCNRKMTIDYIHKTCYKVYIKN